MLLRLSLAANVRPHLSDNRFAVDAVPCARIATTVADTATITVRPATTEFDWRYRVRTGEASEQDTPSSLRDDDHVALSPDDVRYRLKRAYAHRRRNGALHVGRQPCLALCPPATAAATTTTGVCEPPTTALGDRHSDYVSVCMLARRIVIVDELWPLLSASRHGCSQNALARIRCFWVTESRPSTHRLDAVRGELSFVIYLSSFFVCPESIQSRRPHTQPPPTVFLIDTTVVTRCVCMDGFLENRQLVAGHRLRYGRQQWSQASGQLA